MKQRLIKVAVNLARLVLALTFVFSGFVKLVDPLGTQYKLHDYMEAMGVATLLPDILVLALSVALATVEFCLGLFLLFAISRRLVSRTILLFMTVMTLLTVWIALDNPVSDCGCFGDAIVLTNLQTLGKNIILMACALLVNWHPLSMTRFISKNNQWIVVNYSILFSLFVATFSLYYLPAFDFRPYRIGTDIKQAMVIPDGAKQPEFETTFILEKDGEQKEFTLEDYPDSTWTFIDSKTVQTAEGYIPPIHDFAMELVQDTEDGERGDDITDEVLSRKGYTMLLISPHLKDADDSQLDKINHLHDYCRDQGYPFYCLTASTAEEIGNWKDITGAEYPYCSTDETTLKTVIRSNPGLVLIKDGVIIRKWSHNDLPDEEEINGKPLEQLEMGKMPADETGKKVSFLLMWFVLPLALLVLADRMWAWTSLLRKRKR